MFAEGFKQFLTIGQLCKKDFTCARSYKEVDHSNLAQSKWANCIHTSHTMCRNLNRMLHKLESKRRSKDFHKLRTVAGLWSSLFSDGVEAVGAGVRCVEKTFPAVVTVNSNLCSWCFFTGTLQQDSIITAGGDSSLKQRERMSG